MILVLIQSYSAIIQLIHLLAFQYLITSITVRKDIVILHPASCGLERSYQRGRDTLVVTLCVDL